MRAMENLSVLGIPIRISCVISRLNYKTLPELAHFFIKLRGRGVGDFSFTYSVYEGQMWQNRELFVPLSEVAPFLNQAMQSFVSQKVPPPYLRLIPYCFVPRYASCVGMDEYTRAVDVTGVERNSRDAIAETRIKAEPCRRCLFYSRCPGLETSYIRLWGADEIVPIERLPPEIGPYRMPMEVA
ncbi:MAG: hypothetical protein HY611_06735 [Elusimicrobia bacterium]|nr:hypothetical protein [Elusimicrobiota bacterium]